MTRPGMLVNEPSFQTFCLRPFSEGSQFKVVTLRFTIQGLSRASTLISWSRSFTISVSVYAHAPSSPKKALAGKMIVSQSRYRKDRKI